MRVLTNHLLWTNVFTASSAISAMLHPLRFIRSGGHVRRGLSLSLNAGSDSMDDSMEGSKTLQDLLQEMQSIRQGITSAIDNMEIMANGNPEINSTQVNAVEVSQDAIEEIQSLKAQVCSTKIALTGIQDSLRDSVKMRRIEFAIAHHEAQKTSDPCLLPDELVFYLRAFTQLYDFDRKLCGSIFDFNSFVVSTLYKLHGNKGVHLPDVVYNEDFIGMDSDKRREVLEKLDDGALRDEIEKFHKITVGHIGLILGSKPRIESHGEKRFLFYDWN